VGAPDLPAIGSDGVRDDISRGFALGEGLPSLVSTATTLGTPYQMQSISIGGKGGAAGDGGDIHITNSGDIFTAGTASIGIFAQSVGGGGGMGGSGSLTPSEIAVPMAGGGGGDGGDVTVIHTGNITT